MDQHETKILRSYSKVWKIERVFYQFGEWNLPNPIALNTVIYFTVFFFLMFFLSKIQIIGNISGIYRYAVIPGVLAWTCNNKMLDGKNPLGFIKSILMHCVGNWFVGSRLNRYKYIKSKDKARYTTRITYRTIEKL